MKRNKHSLSHYKLATFDMGELIPCGLFEVLPGDTVQQATSALIRVSPLLAPVMHPVRVRIHHWFVPHRLIWEDFEKFITGGPDGLDASVLPTFSSLNPAEGSLADYFGLPIGTAIDVSALPFRAYSMIWNEYYRDQDLQDELVVSKASGNDEGETNQDLQNVCWEKDYFTTARPWTQKGPQVTIPLGGSAAVVSDGSVPLFSPDGSTNLRNLSMTLGNNDALWNSNAGATGDVVFHPTATGLEADLTTATAATILQIREAMALQRFAEARARFGSRYTEYLRSLGVTSRDSRLDRPEYLGGGRQTIQFSEILQTGTDYNGNTGVGNMRGHGIGAMRSNRYRRFFDEHGYVISLISVMPKTMYAQGIAKHWKYDTNEDFFQKELQDIGQVEVLNSEVYAGHSTPGDIFGYQDRYDQYRRMESGICGEFRSSLSHWHMARVFAADPALNASFVSANPTKRVFASTATDGLYAMVNHSIQARRLVR